MRQPDWQTADGAVRLFLGDCLPLLSEMEAGSVDAVVTDPPYEITAAGGGILKPLNAYRSAAAKLEKLYPGGVGLLLQRTEGATR